MSYIEPPDTFYLFNNRNDFLDFITGKRDIFSCVEDWQNFFGFSLMDNENGEILETVYDYAKRDGKFSYEPDKYPCIVYFSVDRGRDGLGYYGNEIFDWTSVEELESRHYNNRCGCWESEHWYLKNYGACNGTKEREPCKCGGDRQKCDFYKESD